MRTPHFLSFTELRTLIGSILQRGGLSAAHSTAIAAVIAAAERDKCRSHGIYRIKGVLAAVTGGIADPNAEPSITPHDGQALLQADAHGGFSPLALEQAAPLLAKKARCYGIAALAINDCVHFSALWPEVETLAEQGLAALAMCPSNAYVAPAGGITKLLGTNPFAFAWPATGGAPYVFDFATAAAARGEVELLRLDGKSAPEGWGIDANGQATTDPAAILSGALLTFGGYKGSAIATMIEILAGIWIADRTSAESSALDAGRLLAPRHGELIIAFDPQAFGAVHAEKQTEALLDAIRQQGARLPSARRYAARALASEQGIAISAENYDKLQRMHDGDFSPELH